jgi:host factor-I protein
MDNKETLQNVFLERLHKDATPVSIFLISGIKLHGVIDKYDQNVILLKNSITQMIFKHAVSTIVPAKNVSL